MLQTNYLIIVYATLGSFCLEITGSGTKLSSNENKESYGTNPQAWLEDTEGYKSDQPASTAWQELVESKLRNLNPTVYCGGNSMTLRVQGSIMPNFMIDGGDGPVPLTQIPADCGLSITQGPTDAGFTVHYQGCHVTQQEEGHVLPLSLWGMPMKMSCPLAMYTHPSVSCLPSHMVTKLNCNSANALKLKVNGKWDPFILASSTCGITVETETDGVVVTAPYQSSCWQIKGDERFLSILYGNEELILSCPDSHDAHPYGRVEIMSYKPNLTTPDTTRTTNISAVTTGPISNPKQPMFYPFGYMHYGYAGEIPAGMSTATAVTVRPTTNSPATVFTSPTVNMIHYPFGPMMYHHKTKPHGYPWGYPTKAHRTAPAASQKTATTSNSVASNPLQPQHPSNQKHYPFGIMPYHPKPIPYGYPWAIPAKVPTTAPITTTFQTIATTSTTVASYPKQPPCPFTQKHHLFGIMPYHPKPIPYGHPCGFPAKEPTTVPTTTTSQTTTTTASVASNPQQPPYPSNQKHHLFGIMPYHPKPIPYGYPWEFPAKAPTTVPTTTTSQTTTTTASVASNPQQPPFPSNQKHYLFGIMPYHPKLIPYGYPWGFPAKAPTTVPTSTTSQTTTTTASVASNPQQPPYPSNQKHHLFGIMPYHPKPIPYGYPWAFPAKAPTTVPTTTTSQSAATTSTTVARNPRQPLYPSNQKHYPFSIMPYHPKPIPYGCPWAIPTKAPTTAPTTTTSQSAATTSSTVATNPQQPSYAFNQGYYPFGPMMYHTKPISYGYPCVFPAQPPTTLPSIIVPNSKTATTATKSSTVASNPRQTVNSFNQMHYSHTSVPYHRKPVIYGFPWAFPSKVHTTTPTKTTPTTKMAITLQTTATTLNSVANDPNQSGNSFNQMHFPLGPLHCHHEPSHYLGYPLAFPAKFSNIPPNILAPTTKATAATTTTTPTTVSINPQRPYPFNQLYYPFGPMHCHHRPSHYLSYPLVIPVKASTTASSIPASND